MIARFKPLCVCVLYAFAGLLFPLAAVAQPPDAASAASTPPADSQSSENWNLYYQATTIGDYHGTFNAPYTGPLSLQNYPERDVSLTTTLFFDWRIEKNTQLIFDPEIAGG